MSISLTDRRRFLAMVLSAPVLLPLRAVAEAGPIGNVTALLGEAMAVRSAKQHDLHLGSGVEVQDLVKTGEASYLSLQLGDRTSVRLGADCELLIDQYIAGIEGTFDLSRGAMVFDRPEDAPRSATTVRTVFGSLGVRGTRFFAGPSRGVFGVFVDRGLVEVTARGESVQLGAGDGVNLTAEGIDLSSVQKWGQGRIDEAFASVGL